MKERIESRMESRMSTTFDKDADNFLNKLEDEMVHQLAPRTSQESTLFRFDNEEFEQLEEFANKIATLLNKNNEIEQKIQTKRDDNSHSKAKTKFISSSGTYHIVPTRLRNDLNLAELLN